MADVQRVDWTAERYHSDDRLSRSLLADYDGSPSCYHAVRIAKTLPAPTPSASMELGTLFHLAVLEPGKWQAHRELELERAKVPPAYAGDGAKRRREEWRAALGPFDVEVTERERLALIERQSLVDQMAAAVLEPHTPAARAARRILDASEREVTYTWRDVDPELVGGPLGCRCRIDLEQVTADAVRIADLKSTADPSPRRFGRAVFDYHYHWQAPFYAAPLFELHGRVAEFRFIAVRSAPPFEVAIYQLRREDIDAADAQVRRAMRRLSKSLHTNQWAAPWETAPQVLDMPPWALKDEAA